MTAKNTSAPAAKGRTLADFRAAHDRAVVIPTKIQTALDKMLKDNGPEHYEYEADFMKLAGVGQADISKFRDKFSAFIAIAQPVGTSRSKSARNAWFATTKAAKAARGE